MSTLQQIIDYSKANPNTAYAQNAAKLIQSGEFDTQALKEGIDLSVYGRPVAQPKVSQVTPPVVQTPSFIGTQNNATSGSTQAIPDSTTPSTVNALYNTGKSVVSGTVESGKDLGAAISAPIVQKAFNSIDKADQQGLTTILQLRQQAQSKGQNTAHYDNLIKNYQLSNNQTVADVFPALKKSNEQVIGDFASMALEAVSAGSYAPEASTGTLLTKGATTAEKGLPLAQRVIQGAKTGAAYGAGFGATGAMQDNQSLAGIAKSSVVGGVTGAVLGGATEGLIGKKSPEEIAKIKAADNAKFDNLTGTIVQGKTSDIPKAQKALSSIDVGGIKTYADLTNALDEKVSNLSSKLDETLATSKETKKLPDLTLKSKVGDETVSHNYVTDAIDQLKTLYQKTNDPEGLAKITQLETKAKSTGLTVKEINDLAKIHGQELNAFNVNGEAASGLSKQAAENTRSGLKSTGREMYNNPVYKAADSEITNLIRTHDLTQKVADRVTQLKQKVTERGWGEKIGRLVFQISDKLTGGGLKGFIQSFVPRGEGLKIMNALDLEKGLQKNLNALQKVLDSNAPASTIEKQLQDILDGKTSFNSPSVGKTVLPENLKNNFKGFPRDTQLKGVDAQMQENAIHKYLSQKSDLLKEYVGKYGKISNADEAKNLFEDVGYNGKNSANIQEAASELNKDAWRYNLQHNPQPDATIFIGGSGAGKTSVVKKFLPEIEKNSAAILDGNFSNIESGMKRVTEAVDAGKTPRFVYTYRDFMDAWENGVIKRLGNPAEKGRIVPSSVFASNHPGALDSVKALLAKGYKIEMLDNSLGEGKGAYLKLDKFNNIVYPKDIRSQIVSKTKELLKNGVIDKEQYDRLIK